MLKYFANAAQKPSSTQAKKSSSEAELEIVKSVGQPTSIEKHLNITEESETEFSSTRPTPAREKVSATIDTMTQ